MRPPILPKVISAAVGTLVVELSGIALDKAGLSEDRTKVSRVIIRAAISAGTTLLLSKLLGESESDVPSEAETAGSTSRRSRCLQ